jgi:protein O-GlcNAc transferase
MNSPRSKGSDAEDQSGRLDEAMRAFKASDLDGAKAACDAILSEDKSQAGAYQLLSAIQLQSGHIEAAHQSAKRAVTYAPHNAFYKNGLGLALHALGRLEEAEEAFNASIELEPQLLEPRSNKATVQIDRNQLKDALETLEDALRLDPSHFTSLVNKGVVLHRLGRVEEAIYQFDAARKQNPNSVDVARNRLMLLHYSSAHSATDIFNQTMDYWRLADSNFLPQKPQARNKVDANKKPLRIGYVSADFQAHTIGRFFRPILGAHNEEEFHTILYANNSTEDDVTKALQASSGDWRNIAYQSDEQVSQQIQHDKIDILVDLSGHTDGHRLGVFRRKPAPIQMTWLGYFATTGLPEIDYILADRHVLPEADEALYTEKPLRLPESYFCFQPPESNLPLHPLPCLKKLTITFGCLNNITKLNADVVSVWSKILDAVPGSSLLIKSIQLSDEYIADSIRILFTENRITPERLVLLGKTNRQDHMAAYNSVDIALDPFPFGGGMTTLEALWMGIPVVTLSGGLWVSRVGASILSTAGFPDMITTSHTDYIEKAVELARNREGLVALRRDMRIILNSSPLCDIDRYTRRLEKLYQYSWQTWCLS